MIEDGIYAVNLIDEMFYRVEGDDIRISIDGGEWRKPVIETTREKIKIYLDCGDVARVSDL
ncbi:hypothetical protein [Escherichia coli]|uniref:hypothetical protein n=1 Tax=Escherichia coli TaxID=562 RepID=UPI00263AFBCE|nr:hypothetical protein [Escherichia coli]MDN4877925.1 hypothetical protein [Escherichia coli]